VPRLLLYYHFFHPDDVVSSRHFGDLATEQQRRGWDVTVVTSNRFCRERGRTLPSYENWNGIQIHRVYRPDWEQSTPLPRLANSAWMIGGWFLRTLSLRTRFDAIVIGSDPAFSPALALGLRLAYPKTPLVHWCFDLYPEAIEVEGMSPGTRALAPAARRLMRRAYQCYDRLVDLGPCMRDRLASYRTGVAQETLVPWALVEAERPAEPDPVVRAKLFGDAKLALLYSGTLGRAHEYADFLRLARVCRARSGNAIVFCFASRGYRFEELRRSVGPDDTNIAVAPFAEEGELQPRLEAADVHLLSLKAAWAGIVVPSKFFGSLAVGRPVLFSGPAKSEIASWIAQYDVGLHLEDGKFDAAVDRLHGLIDDRETLIAWKKNALAVHHAKFSIRVVNDQWDLMLRELAGLPAPAHGGVDGAASPATNGTAS
jgi:colanic acid biosynthesis glycosyl transferase WcaI